MRPHITFGLTRADARARAAPLHDANILALGLKPSAFKGKVEKDVVITRSK